MIDQCTPSAAAPPADRVPLQAGTARALVLAAVFVCAACGLVYELELVATASYLVGDTVTQTSVVLSVMVFAMGIGSLLAKRLRRVAAVGFGAIEAVLAAVGGLSVMALYAGFAWLGSPAPVTTGFAFAIGVLLGAEVPLLMTLMQRIRRQDAGGAVADLFAADYVGALVGGLAFPFLLLPRLGQLDAGLLTGAVNAGTGGATVLWLFRADLSGRARRWLLTANLAVLALLAVAAAGVGTFERAARQALYGGDVRLAERTSVQQIVVAGTPARLYLDGRRRDPALDAALVDPAMTGRAPHRRVLVLGGGDGIAAAQALRYPGVSTVTVVDPDARLIRLARTDPGLEALNHHVYRDGRVRAVAADPFGWLRALPGSRARAAAGYDVIVADVPGPGMARGTELHSAEFYGLAVRALVDGGRLAVQGGPLPDAAGARRSLAGGDGNAGPGARVFWTVDAGLRAVGLHTCAYRVGGQGYLLARPLWGSARWFAVRLPTGAEPLRGPSREPPASTLTHPRL